MQGDLAGLSSRLAELQEAVKEAVSAAEGELNEVVGGLEAEAAHKSAYAAKCRAGAEKKAKEEMDAGEGGGGKEEPRMEDPSGVSKSKKGRTEGSDGPG